MQLKQKLLSACLVISLLAICVSYGINYTLQENTIQSFKKVGGEMLPGDLALSRMTTELYHTLILAMRYGEKKGNEDRLKIEEALSTIATFKTMHLLYHHDDKIWSERIDESTQRFSSYITEYVLLVNKGEQDNLFNVRQKIDDVLNDFVSTVNPHIEEEFTLSRQNLELTLTRTHNTKKILIASSVLLLLITLIISLFISQRLSKPILQLRDAALEIGQGKLDFDLPLHLKDEIGELASAFNQMVKNLSDTREDLYKTNQKLKLEISERKEMERELLQSQKMEAIGTLAGGIAHDFNNILTSILGYSDLALIQIKTKVDTNLLEYLENIHQSGLRARNLVTQILTFSRKTKEEKKNISISLIVEDAVNMLRSTIPATIDIKKEVLSQAKTFADPTQIHQVIMNLCTNAYHALRDTGGTIAVTLHEVELSENDYPATDLIPGRYLKLEVSDTGKGIDADIREKIFEPYFTTKEVGKGTGLGLAVVHGIVKGHNGHISLYSEPGQGTTFHVYLPIVEIEDDESFVSKEEKQAVGGTERIIIVDDEDAIVNYVNDALEIHGYTITSYTNGLQALQDFSKRPEDFDLVITDMSMPYMTGAELSQKLIEIRPDIPIILCTGYSEIINKAKAKAMGIAQYLEKPIIIDTLLKTIRTVLD